MGVREYKDIGLSALVAMNGYTESSRVLRELLIRLKHAKEELSTVDNGRDCSDCQTIISQVESAIGKVVGEWFLSKDQSERFKLSISGMAPKERSALLNTLLNFAYDGEPAQPQEVDSE